MAKETILDASEEDQIQAAIRASLVESAKPATSYESASEEDDDDSTGWFDSESDSRTGDSAMFQKSVAKKEDAKQDPEPVPEPPSPVRDEEDNDWQRHLGPETDPTSSIIFRFPDGSKEQKTLPCTSTLTVCTYYFSPSLRSRKSNRARFKTRNGFF